MVPRVARRLDAFVKCLSVVCDLKGQNSENHRVLALEGDRPVIWEETEAEWEVTCFTLSCSFGPFLTMRHNPE